MKKYIWLLALTQAPLAQGLDDTIYVIGSKEKEFNASGSAKFIDQAQLEEFQYSDIGRILDKVAGVYIQEEDGLGLRPNIGLRGAHPHRSKKVTLMEDGILIGPAPYSAPAAYYFPTPLKASNIEVFKGPAAVKYGPNSIGGAVNIITPALDQTNSSFIQANYGLVQRFSASTQGFKGRNNWRLDYHKLRSDGFKEIDNNADTGFDKNDISLKYKYLLDPSKNKTHNIGFKLSFSDEKSHETYLGVSEDDFNDSPFKRYNASELDLMTWKHYQVNINHFKKFSSNFKISSTLYHHEFKRKWEKVNKFVDDTQFSDVILKKSNATYLDILKGKKDSANANQNLILGNNDRAYFSQGISVKSEYNFDHGDIYHTLSTGIRFHRDQVDRAHTISQVAMLNGNLEPVDGSFQKSTDTKDTSHALTVYAEDEIFIDELTLKVGSRIERVETKRTQSTNDKNNDDTLFIPGISGNYTLNENTLFLFGVNKGVTLVGPGQDNSIKPEESINYELGLRVKAPVYFEMISFYSDYSNIKGTCTFSSGCSGADLDKEYNGGEAEIFGIETNASYDLKTKNYTFPLSLTYTRTVARFTKDTTSDNKEWGIGEIKNGDPLPYIPQDQFNAKAGIKYKKFSANLNITWKGKMSDQSVETDRKIIPSYGIIDFAADYKYSKNLSFKFKADNLLDNKYLVSYRPYGARPGKPQMFSLGFKYKF